MYKEMSQIYDQLMREDVDYDKWSGYVQSILEKYQVQVATILDLGCGTGNITIPLSKMGYEMTGVDLSEDMLSIADGKAFEQKQNIKWIQGDMSGFSIKNAFDAIISCCDCVNYILETEDILKVFQNAYTSLREGGVFTFDIHAPYTLKQIYRNETFTYTSDELCYIWENSFDEDSSIIEYYLNIFIKKHRDPYYTRSEEIHYQRAYEIEEIKELLLESGFKTIDVFGFGSFEEPNEKTERLQFCSKS